MDKPWVKSLIVFLYLVGPRITEAVKIKRKDIWVEDGRMVVRIYALKKRAKLQTAYATNAHLLHISLNAPFLQEVLLPYIERITDPEARVWRYSRQWAWVQLKKANPKISPHIFRHDRLTKLALLGADPFTIQDWAGWSDVRPASYYVHATGNLAAKFADKIT